MFIFWWGWGNFVCRRVTQIRTAAHDGDCAVGVNRTVAVEPCPSPSNQISQYQMFSFLQSMTTLSTSRHVLGLRIVLTSLVRVDVVDVADTSSRHEHLPEIKFRLWKASEFTILIFEITFFLKTDKLKSAFKLRLTSSGRKLWPILVLLYFQVK